MKVTTVSLAMDQMLGTALLLLIILAVTDEENMKIISSLVPVIIGLGLSAIHLRSLSLALKLMCLDLERRKFKRKKYFQLWSERWLSDQPRKGLCSKTAQLPRWMG